MLGDFSYSNPTKLYFGEHSLEGLRKELPAYGKNVLLVYGGGSIRKNGIYDRVVEILKACGKEIVEDGGVMPNPTVEKLYEGCRRAREGKVELILAVGGGSVCDYAKAVSVSAYCEEDPWEKYYLRMEDADNKIIPVGCVLTMVGTGSEMTICSPTAGAATPTRCPSGPRRRTCSFWRASRPGPRRRTSAGPGISAPWTCPGPGRSSPSPSPTRRRGS